MNQVRYAVKAKARLVAKGYTLVEHTYYLEIFTTTSATASIRMMKTFAPEHN